MNSDINTLGKAIISGSKGMLLGGRMRAVKGVDTYNLGNSSHIRTFLEVGRNVLYDKQQAEFEKRREQILEQLSMLEERWNKILKSLPPDKEKAVELIKKLNGAIVAKDHELADLDADISKLAHITDEGMKAVLVRGNAYEGSVIEINTIKYMLRSNVSRIIFKLKNKNVVMVRM